MTGEGKIEPDFEDLIEFIQERRGVDFRGYKRTSLRRRLAKRMEEAGAGSFAEYHALLEASPGEFAELLDTVLVNVTGFFRDPDTWEALRREVVPRIVGRHRDSGKPIRVWSAGCATGQEPYGVAMLLAEEMGGAEAFCRGAKVYATDLDEGALQAARQAGYTDAEVEGVPPDLLDRYFERSNGRNALGRDLRRGVIFGRHNVVHDAPIGHADLVLCRNLLIYLEPATQDAVLQRLHYALVDNGFLCLGRAETQLARSGLFAPVDVKNRVFAKAAPQDGYPGGGAGIAFARGADSGEAPPSVGRLQEAIVDASATAYLAVDMEGRLAFANPAARRLLETGASDIGRPFHDLPASYLHAELRGRIEEAQRLGRAVRLEHHEVQRPPAEGPLRLTVEARPLFGPDGRPFATLVAFTDISRAFQLAQELQATQEGLETHIEELQSSNEELETTNEELQSTREELETTNEELQSTNEELETMNEELRSANEELEVANEELRRQSEGAAEFRCHAEAVLRSMDAGIVVLDRDLRVLSWNRWCENTWGLRAEEAVGEAVFGLDIGLPVQRLRPDLHRVLAAEAPRAAQELEALDRRGRRVRVRVRAVPLLRDGRAPGGAVLVLEDVTEAARDEDRDRRLGRVVGRSLNEVCFLDPATLRFTLANRGAEEKLGYPLARLRQTPITELMPRTDPGALRGLVVPLLAGERREAMFETVLRAADGREYPAEIRLQHFADEEPPVLLAIVHDTSGRRRLHDVR